MKARGSYRPTTRSANVDAVRRAFVRNAHSLIALGHAKLPRGAYSGAEEEEITGDLLQAMEAVLDDPKCPRALRPLSPQEELRIHSPDRKGKNRKRVDVRFTSSALRPRPRLSFEAKRLGGGHKVGGYLGKDGLGCFLEGHYAADQPYGGMLGYVQAGTPDDWAEKIENALADDPNAFYVHPRGRWRKQAIVRQLSHTYLTKHRRPNLGRLIDIHHVLLDFN